MKQVKYLFVAFLIIFQWIAPFLLVIEYVIRGGGDPMLSLALLMIVVVASILVKDSTGGMLFQQRRGRRFGWFTIFSFDLLNYL